jgi:hypothetical protein
MMAQLTRIKAKLARLKRKDKDRVVFGAAKHNYRPGPVKTNAELKGFEAKYSITLPAGYLEFLRTIGDGGAGPYYGLEQLEDGIYADLDYKRKDELTDPSKPFLLTGPWNMELHDLGEEEYSRKRDEEYFDEKWTNGLLRICNFGCGVSINLVVNGADYGKIWVDDRCNEGGIYPDRYFGNEEKLDFLTWYELWLDKSLQELDDLPKQSWWQRLFA